VTNLSPKGQTWARQQIRDARLAPLVGLLQKRGLQLVAREACNFIVKDSYWRWSERNLAGNAIDFFMRVLGLSFHDDSEVIRLKIAKNQALRPRPGQPFEKR
jgi:hypothetical protein